MERATVACMKIFTVVKNLTSRKLILSFISKYGTPVGPRREIVFEGHLETMVKDNKTHRRNLARLVKEGTINIEYVQIVDGERKPVVALGLEDVKPETTPTVPPPAETEPAEMPTVPPPDEEPAEPVQEEPTEPEQSDEEPLTVDSEEPPASAPQPSDEDVATDQDEENDPRSNLEPSEEEIEDLIAAEQQDIRDLPEEDRKDAVKSLRNRHYELADRVIKPLLKEGVLTKAMVRRRPGRPKGSKNKTTRRRRNKAETPPEQPVEQSAEPSAEQPTESPAEQPPASEETQPETPPTTPAPPPQPAEEDNNLLGPGLGDG